MKIIVILLALGLCGCGRITEGQGDNGLSQILKEYGK